jgi:hypothetical protein
VAGNLFRFPPELFLPVEEIPQPIPVTAFRGLIEDPYSWALQAVLGVKESAFDLQELDPMSFGSLAHSVLEEFARSPEAGSSDPVEIRRCLDRLLNRQTSRVFGSSPLPAVPLQVEQVRMRLGAFADWQAMWVEEGWRIVCAEARTPPEGIPFDVDGEPVFLAGRIDRIDRNPTTGAWIVFDYKMGESGVDPSSALGRNGEWKDLQLPLYRRLLSDLRAADGSRVEAPKPGDEVSLAYLSIPKDLGSIAPAVAEWTSAELAAAEETARQLIRGLRQTRGIRFDPERTGKKVGGELATLLGRGLLQEEEG